MNENKLKVINGLMCKNGLLSILQDMQHNGEIVYCTKNWRCGYEGYDESQFFAAFYLEFRDGTGWILYTTNSIRSDRMCIQQWNAEHIKLIKPSITKAFVIVPDEITSKKELNEVDRYKKKICEKSLYSAIDDILTLSDFQTYLQNHAN